MAFSKLVFQDFANAIDKMSRAGYKGKHGDFEVPAERYEELNALYMQATVGDYGTLTKYFNFSIIIEISRWKYGSEMRSVLEEA